MKKQLTTAILFAFILLACKKDASEDLKQIKEAKELKTANRANLDTLTLQNVKLYVVRKSITYNISFDWGAINSTGLYATNFQTSISLTPNYSTGFGHTWTQDNALWGIDKKNPDVIIIMITAVDNFWVPTRVGGMNNVKNDATIQVKYDTKKFTHTMSVATSEMVFVK